MAILPLFAAGCFVTASVLFSRIRESMVAGVMALLTSLGAIAYFVIFLHSVTSGILG